MCTHIHSQIRYHSTLSRFLCAIQQVPVDHPFHIQSCACVNPKPSVHASPSPFLFGSHMFIYKDLASGFVGSPWQSLVCRCVIWLPLPHGLVPVCLCLHMAFFSVCQCPAQSIRESLGSGAPQAFLIPVTPIH